MPEDCARLSADAPAVVSLRAPGWEEEYARRGWRMFPSIDRVYDNALARRDLGWRPKWDFAAIVERLRATGDIRGPLAKEIGVKGYHPRFREARPIRSPNGLCPMLSGPLAARLNGLRASAASRSMRKARAAGSVWRPIARP